MSHEDDVRALEAAWKAYAEACCEHDQLHGKHACAELARLIPRQRTVTTPEELRAAISPRPR